MSWRAGAFDPNDRLNCSRLTNVADDRDEEIVRGGALHILVRRPRPTARNGILCLFDGVLDNHRALARELGSTCPHPEELLADAYRRWGTDLPGKLRGDFALLFWDEQRGEGLLARDQLGVRSIFLSDDSGGVYFATEIHHLLTLLGKRPAPDPIGVAHWVAVSNRPGPGTLYTGIRRLDPGAMLLLDRHGVREEHYWTPRFEEPLEASSAELSTLVRESIGCAVRRRLSPDGLTGVMMSGGLDSASVAALAAAQAPGRVAAYSAVFPEHPAVDESSLIDELRHTLALPGATAHVRSGGLVAGAAESARRWQVPLASWGEFWAEPLLRVASSAGVKVILGGDGGDELFGARIWLLADRLRGGHLRQAFALARELPGAGDRPSRRAVARVVRDWGLIGALPYRLHESLRQRRAGRDAPEWLLDQTARDLIDSDDPLAWKRLDGPRWWAHTAHLLTRVVEEAGVFEGHRHSSTTAGILARHPLLDLDLLELGLRQPPSETFHRHLDRPLMRAGMAGVLPDSVRLRPHKALFDSLLVDSLAGADRAAIHELLLGPATELGAYLDLEVLRRTVLADGASAIAPFQWMQQLWRLVTIECWLRAQSDPYSGTPQAVQMASVPSVTLQNISFDAVP
jgi:asparagine synthase (glutamine-hydrolysing)